MKTPITKSILLGAFALGVAGFLPSCVETTSHGMTHHDPGSGRVVHRLPTGYREESFNGVQYYHHSGVYYRKATGGYIVVDAPRPRTSSYRGDGPQQQRRASDSRDDAHYGRNSARMSDNDRSHNDDNPGTGNWKSRDNN